MNRIRGLQLAIATLFTLVPLLAIGIPSALAATTDTWTGTECIGGAPNCNWSDAANWSGGAPANGDALVFSNSLLDTEIPSGNSTDDISGLSVNSITFENDGGGGAPVENIVLAEPLTVTSAINQASSDTVTTDVLANPTSGQALTLGGNVTVTGTTGFVFGSDAAGDELALGGNSLTFVDGSGANSTGEVDLNTVITGSGSVTYDASNTQFVLNGANNYSGTTTVEASNTPLTNANNNSDPFGSSTVTVASGATVDFAYNTGATISNPIVVSGSSSPTQTTSLGFTCGSGCSGPITLNVPHITLNGDTQFANDTDIAVNITGITANGHCIGYLSNGSLTYKAYTGGPTACGAPVAKAPGSPDTGLGAIRGNPVAVLLATTFAALVISVIVRRLKIARQ